MLRGIFSVLVWLYYAFCILVTWICVTTIFLITYPFDTYREYPNRFLGVLAFSMIKFNPFWEFKVEGRDKFNYERPVIFVANHQSFLDMAMAYMLPWKMKWVSKKSLFYIPFFGWLISMTGHVSVDRSRKTSIKRLESLVEPLEVNIPVMMFPEGTRSRDGSLMRFKSGAFMLAYKFNYYIQPMVFNGGHKILPADDWRFRFRGKLQISVLDPIDPEEFDDINELRDHTHAVIEEELIRLKKLNGEL